MPIDISYWKAYHWLRSPFRQYDALVTSPSSSSVGNDNVDYTSPAVAAALKINLSSSVIFAGNAAISDIASGETAFGTFDFSSSINTFNLRIKGEEVGGTVTNNNGVLTSTANSDERSAPR